MSSDNDHLESGNEPTRAEESFLPLLVALVLMLVLLPMLQPLPLLTSAIATFVLLAGLLAVLRDRPFRLVVIGALALCLPLRWVAQFWGHRLTWLILSSHVTVVATLAILEAFVLARVLTHSRVTRQTVIGAICGYLMIGILFAFVYAGLTFVNPDAIAIAGQPFNVEQVTNLDKHVSELAYFSFITLTTVGYGDIVPVSPIARSAVILEALAGQLYLAAFIARLIGAMSPPVPDSPKQS